MRTDLPARASIVDDADPEVIALLAGRPALAPVVAAAPAVLARTVGVARYLCVAHDPEVAGMTSLVIGVETHLGPDAAADALDAARAELWDRLGPAALHDVLFRFVFR